MDWIWIFVTSMVLLHMLAFILWLNWTRVEASSASVRVNKLIDAFRMRNSDAKAAPGNKLL